MVPGLFHIHVENSVTICMRHKSQLREYWICGKQNIGFLGDRLGICLNKFSTATKARRPEVAWPAPTILWLGITEDPRGQGTSRIARLTSSENSGLKWEISVSKIESNWERYLCQPWSYIHRWTHMHAYPYPHMCPIHAYILKRERTSRKA